MSTLREHVAQPRGAAQLPLLPGEGKHYRAYLAHRVAHPEVFAELVTAAREAKRRGWTRLGIRALWERARWRRGPKPRDAAGFHMNDHLTSYYARSIMAACPDLEGMFELRVRTEGS